jgi:hypothetical protein
MRRGSIVGPLILILIGALFLANNVRPDISVMDVISRFWPFVLIGWGALRLFEIFFLAARRRPLPSSGVSGGEWTLIVFLTIICSGVSIANRHIGWWTPMHIRIKGVEVFGDAFDFPLEERTIAAGSKSPRVIVENWRGATRINGAAITDVKVSGRKTVRAMNSTEAEKANREAPLDILNEGGAIVVRSNLNRSQGERFIVADLQITVPRGANITVRGRSGDFDITDIDGDVDIDSDNAGVRLQNIAGSVRSDTRRSDIIRAIDVKGGIELKGRGNDVELENIGGQVTLAGAFFGDMQFRNVLKPIRYDDGGKLQIEVRVESCPGQLRVGRGYVTADSVVGPIAITARSKDVQINDFSNSIDVRLDRGDVELRPGKLPVPKMDITTRTGHIDLALPEGANFTLKATANKGEVTNDFGSPLHVNEEGRGATMSGSVGEGPTLILSTDRGSITVRKGSALADSPLTPQPPPRPPVAPRKPRPETL